MQSLGEKFCGVDGFTLQVMKLQRAMRVAATGGDEAAMGYESAATGGDEAATVAATGGDEAAMGYESGCNGLRE
jgi:hypothetical protein